jgi:DNA helicase-2/ATP-dependent DNA helicase PcrA
MSTTLPSIRRKARDRRAALGFSQDTPHTAAEIAAALTAPTDAPAPAAHADAHRALHGDHECAGGQEADIQGMLAKIGDLPEDLRREDEADAYAAELLLPTPLMARLFWEERLRSSEIAATIEIDVALVQSQMAHAVLLPTASEEPSQETAANREVTLDPSQRAAAEAECGPLLLGAGPGTGKTKTLVGRCQFLTRAQGVKPEQILALTFSRDAAREMRERLLSGGVGTERSGPWVGTFHSFGLEILRRYGSEIGLPEHVKLLGALDAVTLLENHLDQLELDVLDNLRNPAYHLRGILRQISRAKDELCLPLEYDKHCAAMQDAATAAAEALVAKGGKKVLKKDLEVVEKLEAQATKAREVARCYHVYESLLAAHGYLDFADLISRAVGLLEQHPHVLAELQTRFPHVLADEYQDVNRGCARLVRLLAGEEAHGLWAVGDHRQSIYRFRGASPANVAAFGRDYPGGQRLELGVNYRSRRPIVDCFASAARGMAPELASEFPSWEAARGAAETQGHSAVLCAVAPDDEGQADGVAKSIAALRSQGWAYRDQAILCRTHAQAQSFVDRLSERGVPILYLGALLERPEIKDLICLLSLYGGGPSTGIVRIASLPEYAVPREDILILLRRAMRDERPFFEALADVVLWDGLSPAAIPGLGRLTAQLAALDALDRDPVVVLGAYLFDRSNFVRNLEGADTPAFAAMQKRMAVYQLWELAKNYDGGIVKSICGPAGPPNRIRDFLAHLQRLDAVGESPQGATPDGVEALDAVRIMTAHKAKGLEYPIVYVPNLGHGQFPSRGRHDGIPEPPGLTGATDDETEEDNCLFFVALSRARDHLVLSRSAANAKGKEIEPSPLLNLISPWLIVNADSLVQWPSGRTEAPEASEDDHSTPPALPHHSASSLDQYARCPRQYYYERELQLPAEPPSGAYPKFAAALRQTLRWLDDECAAGRLPDAEALAAQFENTWTEHGPVGRLHEARYRAHAERLLASALGFATVDRAALENPSLRATLATCHISTRPEVVYERPGDGALVIARYFNTKPAPTDQTDKRLALLRKAAADSHPDRPILLELRYLEDGSTVEVAPPATDYKAKLEADRLLKYERSAQGIARRDFAPAPETQDTCAGCGYRWVCPS